MACDENCSCCERIRSLLRRKRDWHEDQASVYARILIDAGLIEDGDYREPIEDEPVKVAKPKAAPKAKQASGRVSKYLEPLKKALADGPKTQAELCKILGTAPGCIVGQLKTGPFEKVDPETAKSPWRLAS